MFRVIDFPELQDYSPATARHLLKTAKSNAHSDRHFWQQLALQGVFGILIVAGFVTIGEGLSDTIGAWSEFFKVFGIIVVGLLFTARVKPLYRHYIQKAVQDHEKQAE